MADKKRKRTYSLTTTAKKELRKQELEAKNNITKVSNNVVNDEPQAPGILNQQKPNRYGFETEKSDNTNVSNVPPPITEDQNEKNMNPAVKSAKIVPDNRMVGINDDGTPKIVTVETSTPQPKLTLEDYSSEFDKNGNIVIPEKRIDDSIQKRVKTATYNALKGTGIENTGMGDVITGIMTPIFTGLEQMQRGNKETKFGREIIDNVLGLANIGIGSIPSMVGVNALSPFVTALTGDVAEGMGMKREEGEKVGHLLSLAPFGSEIMLAGLFSNTAGEFISDLIKDKNIDETDKERIVETVSQVGFFTGLGAMGMGKNIYRNVRNRLDLNSLNVDKVTPKEIDNAIAQEIQLDKTRQIVSEPIKTEPTTTEPIVSEPIKKPYEEPATIIGEQPKETPEIDLGNKRQTFTKIINEFDKDLKDIEQKLSSGEITKQDFDALEKQYNETESRKKTWEKRLEDLKEEPKPIETVTENKRIDDSNIYSDENIKNPKYPDRTNIEEPKPVEPIKTEEVIPETKPTETAPETKTSETNPEVIPEKPRVKVYHGSPTNDIVDLNSNTWFTDSKEYANKYADTYKNNIGREINPTIYERQLDLQKPLNFTKWESNESVDPLKILKLLKTKYKVDIPKEEWEKYIDYADVQVGDFLVEMKNYISAKYDGIKIKDEGYNTYNVFDENQIRESVPEPKKEDVAVVNKEKEPYEMTRGEYDVFMSEDEINRLIKETEKELNSLNSGKSQITGLKLHPKYVKEQTKILKGQLKHFNTKLKLAQEHKNSIKQALSEGKTVSEEVLKDYPDLKNKWDNKNIKSLLDVPQPTVDNVEPKPALLQPIQKNHGKAFDRLVDEDRDLVHDLLYNWNESELSDSGNIKGYHYGRDGYKSTGEDKGTARVSKKDFINWLNSEEPLNSKVYDVDKEWSDNINRAREIVNRLQKSQEVTTDKTIEKKQERKKQLAEKKQSGISEQQRKANNALENIFDFRERVNYIRRSDTSGRANRRNNIISLKKAVDEFNSYSPEKTAKIRKSKSGNYLITIDGKPLKRESIREEFDVKKEAENIKNPEANKPFTELGAEERATQIAIAEDLEAVGTKLLKEKGKFETPAKVLKKGIQDIKEDSGKELTPEAMVTREEMLQKSNKADYAQKVEESLNKADDSDIPKNADTSFNFGENVKKKVDDSDTKIKISQLEKRKKDLQDKLTSGEFDKKGKYDTVEKTDISEQPDFFGKVETQSKLNLTTERDINEVRKREARKEIKIIDSELKNLRDTDYNNSIQTIKSALSKDSGISFGGLSKLGDIADPKVLKAVYDVAKYHLENGAVKLADWGRKMVNELGNWIKPHLRTLWNEITKDRTGIDNVVSQGLNIPKIFSTKKKSEIIKSNIENPQTEVRDINDILPSTKNKRVILSSDIFTKGDKEAGKDVFNYDNFTESSQINQLIKETATENKKAIDEQKRDVRSWVKTQEGADLLRGMGMNEETFLKQTKGDSLLAERIMAGKDIVNVAGKNLLDRIKTLPEGADAKIQLADDYIKYVALVKNLKGLISESGRALNIARKKSANDVEVKVNLANELIKAGFDTSSLPDFSRKALEIIEPTFKDKFYYWWYNSMLSNPLTDVANITGNLTHFGFELMRNAINQYPKDSMQMLRDIRQAHTEGMKQVKDIIKNGETADSKFDINERRYGEAFQPTSKAGKRLKGVLPTTRLAFEDAYFRNMFGAIRKNATLKEISKETGDPVGTVENLIKAVAHNPDLASLDKKFEIYQKHLNALERYIDYGVFQTPLGQGGSLLQRGINHIPPLKLIFPFIKIATNIAKTGLRTTPYGFKDLLNKDLTRLERKDVISRAVTGSALLAGLGYLISQGSIEITGHGVNDKDKRELWHKQGYKENHFYMNINGEKYGFSYQNINPLNIPFSIIGNWQDDIKYNTNKKDINLSSSERIAKSLIGMVETLSDQSFMQGISNLMRYIQDKDIEGLKKNAQSLFTPNILSFPRDVKNMLGDGKKQYETNDFESRLKDKIGMTEGLKPKLNQFGEQTKSTYERFPFIVSKAKSDDKLTDFLAKNDIEISFPSKQSKIGDQIINESPETYYQYTKLSGERFKEELLKQLPELEKLTTKEEKDDAVHKIVNDVRKQVREEMAGKPPKDKKDKKGKLIIPGQPNPERNSNTKKTFNNHLIIPK